MNRRRVD